MSENKYELNQGIDVKNIKLINKKKNKFFKILFIFCLFIILIGGIYFFVFLRQVSSENFEVKFEFPKNIYIGTPFNFDLILNNVSNIEVKDVKLILLLPDNVFIYDDSSSKLKQDLGNIKSKQIVKKNFSILVLDEDVKTPKKIKAILDYSLGGRQRFQIIKENTFFVFEEPIKIEVKKPDYIFFEQEFDVFITFYNLTNFYYQKIFLEFIFPKNFELISYENFKQVNLNNFILENINPLENKIIKLKGKIKKEKQNLLEENIDLNFGLILKSDLLENQKDNLILKKYNFSLLILKDIINLDLLINQEKNYIVKNNEKLNFKIQFKNNSPKKMFDITLKVKFLNDFFDFETLKTNGYYDNQKKFLIWNSSNNFDFKVLDPQKVKNVYFSINLKDLTNLNIKNPKLSFEVILESPTIINPKTENTFFKEIFDFRIKNEVSLIEEVYYQDPEGYAMNLDDFSLKTNKKTQLTVYWLIKNKFNDLKNIKIKTFLPSDVNLTKIFFVNNKNKPIYNDKTKELIWFLDKIDAGVGYSQEPIKFIFQIEVFPSNFFINKFIPLINEINFEAEDVFTKEKILIKIPLITSEKISGFNLEKLKVVD